MGRDNREGSIGKLEEESEESRIGDGARDLFFVDSGGVSAEDLTTAASSEYIVYDRCNIHILGTTPDTESLESIDRQGHRCFNCGSLQHIVTKCTEPLDRALIALSRAMFEFFRDLGQGEPERLHEYEERKAQRLQFNNCFVAGSIHGEMLRDALGLSMAASNEDESLELPWLWSMLDWGYPPGWVSEEDPKLKVRARIEGESIWTDDLDAAVIIDNPPQPPSNVPASVSTMNASNNEISTAPTVTEQTSTQRRWAHYPTNLFSSEHLAIYSGVPLPPLMYDGLSSSCTGARMEARVVVPPWRRPGAFSAFGPAGWQEYAIHSVVMAHARRLDYSVHDNSDGNDEDRDVVQSDMDLSE